MESKSENKKNGLGMGGRRVGAVASDYTVARIKRLKSFTAATRVAALVHVDAILERGNYARMKNVAGEFIVSEVVLV